MAARRSRDSRSRQWADAMAVTPANSPAVTASTSSSLPSSSKSRTSGARHRTACPMPAGFGQCRRTSQFCSEDCPGDSGTPESSPRSSMTETRYRRPVSPWESWRARSRKRLLFPLEGSPQSSALCICPRLSIRPLAKAAAQPGWGRATRMHKEVIPRIETICPFSTTTVPATPARQPFRVLTYPCRSSS